MRRRVAIVQPYVPAYRVPLFDRLATILADAGVDLTVVVPDTDDVLGRKDASWPSYVERTSGWTRSVGGVSISWTGSRSYAKKVDLTVLPLMGSALDSYCVALTSPYALWGHGRGYVKRENRLDIALERWLLRRCVHFFSYTDSGARAAEVAGLRGRVSVLRNSTDTHSLRAEIDVAGEVDIVAFRRTYSLDGPVILFLGSLDDSKRLDFVFEASDMIRDLTRNASLLVAGDGPLRPRVEEFCAGRTWSHYIGRVGDAQKAILSKVAHVLINPGRVGLVAVDSLVMGVPLVTTQWPHHAPEFEYLDARTCVVTPDKSMEFARAVFALLQDERQRERMSVAATLEARRYSVERTARIFAEGLLANL
jgi:glycosyltransferase involved in cell wall biosynthesis